jgi:hypothetical protein
MGVAGDPDIDACIRGRSVQLEVKRPGEKPTPLQLKRLTEWQQAAALVGVVTSVAATKALLEENGLLGRTDPSDPAYIVIEPRETGLS